MCQHFFQSAIYPWKRGLVVQNFLTFPNSCSSFRKPIFFLVFILFWVDLKGVVTLCLPHLRSSYIQKPHTIRVNLLLCIVITRAEQMMWMYNIFYFFEERLIIYWNVSTKVESGHWLLQWSTRGFSINIVIQNFWKIILLLFLSFIIIIEWKTLLNWSINWTSKAVLFLWSFMLSNASTFKPTMQKKSKIY